MKLLSYDRTFALALLCFAMGTSALLAGSHNGNAQNVPARPAIHRIKMPVSSAPSPNGQSPIVHEQEPYSMINTWSMVKRGEETEDHGKFVNSSIILAANRARFDNVTAVKSGPGVLVCEPVATGADPGTSLFGAGCARWLEFTVSRHAEFGRTPSWEEVRRACSELGMRDAQFNLPQGIKLTNILGITYIAIGKITGNTSRCTLEYSLYALPGGAMVGAPITKIGSREQILIALPSVATQLIRSLGVSSPRVPSRIQTSADEMILVGEASLYAGTLTPAEGLQLSALGERLPVAALLWLMTEGGNTPRAWDNLATKLLKQASDSPLVCAEVGALNPYRLAPYSRQIMQGVKQYPKNYLFQCTLKLIRRSNCELFAATMAAEQAVRCASRNPAAWLSLSQAFADEAREARRARPTPDMSDAENAFIFHFNARELRAAEYAVQLDPSFGAAWLEVFWGSCAVGGHYSASTAFSNALRLDPEKSRVYAMGLQMFQPKWGGDPAALANVARLAVAEQYPTSAQTANVANGLMDAEFRTEALLLYAHVVDAARKAIVIDPNEAQPHYDLAVALKCQSLWQESIPEYLRTEQLRPTDAIVHWDLGKVLAILGGSDVSVQEERARQYGPKLVTPLVPRATSIQEFQASIRIHPFPEVYEAFCDELTSRRQYAAAIAAGKAFIRMFDMNKAYDSLATVYYEKHDYASCAQECRKSIALSPMDGHARLYLGKALVRMGHKHQAVEQWRIVQQMGGTYKDDADMELALHP